LPERIKEIDFACFKKAKVLAKELAKTNSIFKTRYEIEAQMEQIKLQH